MNLVFYIILAAQFISALVDNSLLFAVLAPFVGAFADSLPKGHVMLISKRVVQNNVDVIFGYRLDFIRKFLKCFTSSRFWNCFHYSI